MAEGKQIAEKNGVIKKLRKIFEFVPGDRSPPPAPKHTTAAANRPKAAKAMAQPRRPAPGHGKQGSVGAASILTTGTDYYRHGEDHYDDLSMQFNGEETPTERTPPSSPLLDDEHLLQLSQTSTGSRKRKRAMQNGGMSLMEQEHVVYGDELLDYFMTSGGDDAAAGFVQPPEPPAHFPIDKTIDNQGNNALHWACSMGDLRVIRDLLARGANPVAPTDGAGETPLIRAVLFTNNYDKETFPRLVNILSKTITERDWHGATVFHHIAETSRSRNKWSCARYYCEVLINKLQETAPHLIQSILCTQDENNDTAVLCAARNGCAKVATFLLTHCPEAGDIVNLQGEYANEVLRELSAKRPSLDMAPSSPLQPGESISKRANRRSHLTKMPTVSRAASTVLTKLGPVMEEASSKLAMMYDSEMKEKETLLTEAQSALKDFDSQRHKVRQQSYALMAKADDESRIPQLRTAYEATLREMESLLEQLEHTTLQSEILLQDQQSPNHAFRVNNPNFLTQDEMRAALPWAKELHQQQMRRRALVRTVATSMAEVGTTSERIGMHRKLVAMATGLQEEELDEMSEELLESLEATADSGGDVNTIATLTPTAGSRRIEVLAT